MTHKEISQRAGRAGTGEKKRRSPEHYRRLAQLGVAARRLKKWARDNGRDLSSLTQ